MSASYNIENNSGQARKQLDNGTYEATPYELAVIQTLQAEARARIHGVIAQMRKDYADSIARVRWVAYDQYRQSGNEDVDPYEDEADVWGAFYYGGEWPSLFHEPEDKS